MTEYVVCPRCQGTGYGDDLGDVTDAISEDPDFADDYMAGVYNTGCEWCKGRNVVPKCGKDGCEQPAEDFQLWLENIDGGIYWPADKCYEHLSPMYQEQVDDHYGYLAEVAAEQRMGC